MRGQRPPSLSFNSTGRQHSRGRDKLEMIDSMCYELKLIHDAPQFLSGRRPLAFHPVPLIDEKGNLSGSMYLLKLTQYFTTQGPANSQEYEDCEEAGRVRKKEANDKNRSTEDPDVVVMSQRC